MLNLHLLRVFYMVAKNNGVSSAAEALYISQPAISNALKRLQKECSIQLFHKVGRNLHLTEEGEELYIALKELFISEKNVEAILQRLSTKGQHTIKLGLATIYERFGVSDILRHFATVNPDISLSIHSGNSATVLEMLQARAIDLALAGQEADTGSLICTPYKRHDLFLVIPPGHRLYGKTAFCCDDIRGERMVLKEHGSSVRRIVDKFLCDFAVAPTVFMELSNLDSILTLVREESCLTILPDMSLPTEEAAGKALGIARCTEEYDFFFLTYVISHPLHTYSDRLAESITQFRTKVAHSQQ